MWPFKRKKKQGYGFSSFEYTQIPISDPREWDEELANHIGAAAFRKAYPEQFEKIDKEGMFKNFAMLIPSGVTVEHTPPLPSRWKRFLCFIGLHDWVNPGISYYGPKHPRKCTRCKKTKWIK
jgi:hypothetical protein